MHKKPPLNELPAIRAEIESLYFCAKHNAMTLQMAKELAGLLKILASLIRDEKELDIEEQLTELRTAINQLKGDQNDASMAA